MELPQGWDQELRRIRGPVTDRYIETTQVRARFEEAVRLAINRAFTELGGQSPYEAEMEEWARIRASNEITHPEPKEIFTTDGEAVDALLHYWVGAEINEDELRRSVMGHGGLALWKEAMGYATSLTESASPERENVMRASDFLWRDYRGGHG